MTPKQHADELIDKYYNEIAVILTEEAIDCALISIENTINFFKDFAKEYPNSQTITVYLQELDEIKKEIINQK
jgi:hypothetical protein